MKVKDNQTLIDIATQYLGSADAAFELAVLNGLSPTVDLVTGMELMLPDIINADVVTYYKNKALCPATAVGVIPDLVLSAVDSYISIADLLQNDEVIVLEGQNFIDLATHYCGSADVADDFAKLNEMVLTATLVAGTRLKKPAVSNAKIHSYFKTKKIEPATDVDMNSDAGQTTDKQGIGYWEIGKDFIVS